MSRRTDSAGMEVSTRDDIVLSFIQVWVLGSAR